MKADSSELRWGERLIPETAPLCLASGRECYQRLWVNEGAGQERKGKEARKITKEQAVAAHPGIPAFGSWRQGHQDIKASVHEAQRKGGLQQGWDPMGSGAWRSGVPDSQLPSTQWKKTPGRW